MISSRGFHLRGRQTQAKSGIKYNLLKAELSNWPAEILEVHIGGPFSVPFGPPTMLLATPSIAG